MRPIYVRGGVVAGNDRGGQSAIPEPSDEQQLVARVRRGDRDAFDAIMHRHMGALLRIAYGYVKSVDDAEDLVQDLFLTIWRKRDEWEVRGSLGAYLSLSIRRRALNALKHRRVRDRYAAHFSPESDVDNEAIDADIIRADDITTARELVGQLSIRARMALMLRYDNGHSMAEVAEILEISVPAAKQLVWRAIEQLRARVRVLT